MIQRDSSLMSDNNNNTNTNTNITNCNMESSSSTINQEVNKECIDIEGSDNATDDVEHDSIQQPFLLSPTPPLPQSQKPMETMSLDQTFISNSSNQTGKISSSSTLSSSTSSSRSSCPKMPILELVYYSRYCCLGLALTLIPSFLVGSWFTHVQTDWLCLEQILFYTRIGSDLIGRFVTMYYPPTCIHYVVR